MESAADDVEGIHQQTQQRRPKHFTIIDLLEYLSHRIFQTAGQSAPGRWVGRRLLALEPRRGEGYLLL
jgi:hypothetical protein